MGNYYGILTKKLDGKIETIEGQMEKSFKDLEPQVDKFLDNVREKLWGDIENWLIGDCASNIHSEIAREVDNIVTLLLLGDKQALEATHIVSGYTFRKLPEIRQAIFDACADDLTKQVMIDKDNQIKDLKERVEVLSYRDRY